MNTDFARIITLLRKEKKLSQKQAAEELGVSQALLSHYEKGIRECGLDFVVRAADYYHVSCDYLLGRTTERSFDDSEGADSPQQSRSASANINRRLADSSLNIIYDLLARIGSRRLTRTVTIYMMMGIYKIFRCLYSANPDNPQDLFTVPRAVSGGYASAAQEKLYTDIEAMRTKDSDGYLHALTSIRLSPESIAKDYPGDAAALFNAVQQAENSLKIINR